MTPREELEFVLSQYADGTLPAAQRDAVEKRLLDDPATLAELEKYRKLDDLLRGSMPLPPIEWEALADRISAEVFAPPAPLRLFKSPRAWIGSAAAVAACLLIAVGVARHSPRQAAVSGDVALNAHAPAIADIRGPQSELPAGSAVADVKLDAAPSSTGSSVMYLDVESVVAQPSHVSISSAVPARPSAP